MLAHDGTHQHAPRRSPDITKRVVYRGPFFFAALVLPPDTEPAAQWIYSVPENRCDHCVLVS
jgi:hypothetical protein